MATRIVHYDTDGKVVFTEISYSDDHSIEIKSDAEGHFYVGALKLYFGTETDPEALANKAIEIAKVAVRTLSDVSDMLDRQTPVAVAR